MQNGHQGNLLVQVLVLVALQWLSIQQDASLIGLVEPLQQIYTCGLPTPCNIHTY